MKWGLTALSLLYPSCPWILLGKRHVRKDTAGWTSQEMPPHPGPLPTGTENSSQSFPEMLPCFPHSLFTNADIPLPFFISSKCLLSM